VIELEYGVTVYPAREGQDRWRAVWYESGKRQQCEGTPEERLAAKLENSILTIIWNLLSDPDARYHDLGHGYYQARSDSRHRERVLIRRLYCH
jgi:hypothetical protein